ncbi:MAG: efflux RND transporter periplasmic adaptor subunit [Burkholderiales bacterium]|nr:efflux RND transporter periplasmic adaptor subunit [Burkholderiales bacterium]
MPRAAGDGEASAAMKSRRRLFVLAPLALLVVLGYFAYHAYRTPGAPATAAGGAAKGAGAPGGAAGKAPAGPVSVEAVHAAAATVREKTTAVGTLRSNESVVVRPEVSGRIARINFAEGSRVERAQLLIALDASVPAAEVEQAKANLALAKTSYGRTVELERQNFVSQTARDQALNSLRVAEAALALAEARLAKTQILAPFSGIIGIRQVSVGDYVKEGQDLVTLEDISALKVDFRVPELLLTRLKRGQTVEVETDALPGKTFAATLDAIDPLVDQNGRALSLRARLRNVEGVLRPGMFVRTRVVLAERPDAVVVPEEAIVPIGAEQFVFRVADGRAERVRVATGVRRAGEVEISSGLRAGDLVVTAGQIKIRDGAAVRVVGAGGAPGSAPSSAGQAAAKGD